jgi:rhodanese-related sulfurtransferase
MIAKIKDLSPTEVRAMLNRGEILLIDVREPPEYAAGRIHGALNFPLSTFDPRALPTDGSRTVVLQCGSGKRSAAAIERCQAAGLKVDSHMAGGILAWRAAGLPTTAFEPSSGAVRDAS